MFDSPCKPDSNYPREPNALNRKKNRRRCDGRSENIIACAARCPEQLHGAGTVKFFPSRTLAGSLDTAIFRRENIIGGQDVFKESEELRGLTLIVVAEETQNSCQQSSYRFGGKRKKSWCTYHLREPSG